MNYKGFNKDMTCAPGKEPFQYAENSDYETDSAAICERGFHSCEMPLDCFRYYQPSKSIYCEVEPGGEIQKKDDGDSKVASSKLHVGAKVSIKDLVKAQIDIVFKRSKGKNTATSGNRSSAATSGNRSSAATSGEESSAATSGYGSSAATSGNGSSAATSGEESSAATSGYGSSAATSGYRSSAATSGEESSAATSGNRSSAATSGYRSSAATSGEESSAATSGDWSSAATSGYRSSAATSGNGSSAATSGEESSAATSNKNAIALASGKNARAKGVIGSYIVLTEWNDDATELLMARMLHIDGKRYKPDTWYQLKNGKAVKADDKV